MRIPYQHGHGHGFTECAAQRQQDAGKNTRAGAVARGSRGSRRRGDVAEHRAGRRAATARGWRDRMVAGKPPVKQGGVLV